MPAPTVSIVMPVRNAAATLHDAVASITGQTFRDWELIAIPDRCEDDSTAILEKAASADPRIRIVQSSGEGLVAALNTEVAAASAPYIARMDADDLCDTRRIALQVQRLDECPRVGACSSLVRFGGDPFAQLGYALHVEWINSLITPEAIALNRFIESPVAHPSVMFRADLIGKHGGYRDGPFPEDYELWLRWMDAGVAFGKVSDSLLVWNDPPHRLSRTDPRYSPDAFYGCKCRYLAKWIKREVPHTSRVHLWGAGRPTRKRFETLQAEGIQFAGYIDVDERKIGGRIDEVVVQGPDTLPPPSEEVFVIVGVGTRGARDRIRESLVARHYREGRHFICAA